MKTFDPFSAQSIRMAINYIVSKVEKEEYSTQDLEFINAYVISLKILHDIVNSYCPNGTVDIKDKIIIVSRIKNAGLDLETLITIPI